MNPEDQTLKQKKAEFAQSKHLEAVLAILKDVMYKDSLVGETEFETVRNAITMDAQATMMMQFINQIDQIKSGSLFTSETQ